MEGEELNTLYSILENGSNFWVQPSTPLTSVDSLFTPPNDVVSACPNSDIVPIPPPSLISQDQTMENQALNPNAGVEQANSGKGKKKVKETWYKGPWTRYEDRQLIKLVETFDGNWSEVAKYMPGRIGKQCRERYHNNLRPNIKKSPGWSDEEEMKIIEGHAKLGNRWSEIARLYVPGRSENAVKNHWHAITRKQFSKKRISRPANKSHIYQSNILENYIRAKMFNAAPTAAADAVAPPPISQTVIAENVPLSIDDYDWDVVPLSTFEIADIIQSLYSDDAGNGDLPPAAADGHNGASTSFAAAETAGGEEMEFGVGDNGGN